jgi:hypothetical protein
VKSITAFIGVFGLVVAASAGAAVDAGPPADAGEVTCKTSDDCSPPTPYCHPTLSVCVQCLADLNCFGVGYVCDQTRGACSTCRTNADCFGASPYCSTKLDRCVECLADSNCGSPGVKCVAGVCGACGDGICTSSERSGQFGLCDDCFAGCAKTDLRSSVGDKVAIGATVASADQSATQCGPPLVGIASFQWTAPDGKFYSFNGGPNTSVSLLDGGCAGGALQCWSSPAAIASFSPGQKIAILIGSDEPTGSYTLAIHSEATGELCNSVCPPGANGEAPCCLPGQTCGFVGPGGCTPPNSVDPKATASCRTNATMRGDPVCSEGWPCSCAYCPASYETCAGETGCSEILSCMRQFACKGTDCYTPAQCASVIDRHGGPMNAAFTDADALAACDRSAGCQLGCNLPPQADASTGTGGKPDGTGGISGVAGLPSSAGRVGAGGDTGSDADASVTVKPKGRTTTGGCGCDVPRGRTPIRDALVAITCLGMAASRRRRFKPTPRQS